jgi:solute carrier family 25 folate transporter 32
MRGSGATDSSDIPLTTLFKRLTTTNAVAITRPATHFMNNPHNLRIPQYPMIHKPAQTSFILASSPNSMKIPIPQNELIEMTEPTESLTFSETQQNNIASLFAGVGSGTLSSMACAPLDLVRTRMQVMGDLARNGERRTPIKKSDLSIVKALRDIVERDGVKGCFRGLGPTLLTVPTFWGLYFPLYETIKKDLHARNQLYKNSGGFAGSTHVGGFHDGDPNYQSNQIDDMDDTSSSIAGPMVHMASAILAGGVADFFCNPMFVVRTRMQTEALHYMDVPISERKPHGISHMVKGIYAEGGIATFWKGFTASLLGLTHVGIQFPVYEYLKAEARGRSESNEESAMDLLLASALSKMIATSTTYPHEVVRSRLMDYRGNDESRKGILNAFRRIVKHEGYAALYTGVHVSLARVLPNCCITFISYELILRWAKKSFHEQ